MLLDRTGQLRRSASKYIIIREVFAPGFRNNLRNLANGDKISISTKEISVTTENNFIILVILFRMTYCTCPKTNHCTPNRVLTRNERPLEVRRVRYRSCFWSLHGTASYCSQTKLSEIVQGYNRFGAQYGRYSNTMPEVFFSDIESAHCWKSIC